MSCPNCSESLKTQIVDNQVVLHCSNCGSSFFEENGINRITIDGAFKLAKDRYTSYTSPQAKHCPRDLSTLALTKNEAVPEHVRLYRCLTCHGVFVLSDDLVLFKKAQAAKIDYLKEWKIPFSAVRSVLVLCLFVAIGVGTFIFARNLQQTSVYRLEAQDVAKTVTFSSSGPYVFISFKTSSLLKSELVLTDGKTGKTTTQTISTQPSRTHFAILKDVVVTPSLSYYLILSDELGNRVETQPQKVMLSNK